MLAWSETAIRRERYRKKKTASHSVSDSASYRYLWKYNRITFELTDGPTLNNDATRIRSGLDYWGPHIWICSDYCNDKSGDDNNKTTKAACCRCRCWNTGGSRCHRKKDYCLAINQRRHSQFVRYKWQLKGPWSCWDADEARINTPQAWIGVGLVGVTHRLLLLTTSVIAVEGEPEVDSVYIHKNHIRTHTTYICVFLPIYVFIYLRMF